MTNSNMWLTHDGVGLGPLRADLAEAYWRWESSLRVMAGYGRLGAETLSERTAGLDSQLRHSDSQARFTIYQETDGGEWDPVGSSSLALDHRYGTAEFFIYLGEETARGRGIGTTATTLVLDWAFHLAQLRSVYLSVIAENTAGVRAYEKAGFKVIGTRRRSAWWLGRPADEILMDAVPEDYAGPRLVEAAVLGDRL
ncbi:GNAT family N-acetyltransferase [Nocardioides sp. NPDC059952]|uniref:GNAT family N-acetyltransferase n=1 Tax=Nocardioides sp. NPDC059952 TaxID=3347014 RepID=UPI0036535670